MQFPEIAAFHLAYTNPRQVMDPTSEDAYYRSVQDLKIDLAGLRLFAAKLWAALNARTSTLSVSRYRRL